MDVAVLEDVGSFVWYSHTIAAFNIQRLISLQGIPSEEELKILANPESSMLMIRLVHHSLGTLYYHGDKIYGPWYKPVWGPDVPVPYNASKYRYGTPYRRRGKNSMSLPTKRAIFGFIDQALAGASNA